MAGIVIDGKVPSGLYLGGKPVSGVYSHGVKVWPTGVKDSYYIDSNGDQYEFELGNTPISNFCTTGTTATSAIIINGVSVLKTNIRELAFGESYREVTALPNNFIRYFPNLDYLSLGIFTNVVSLGDYCLSTVFSNNTGVEKKIDISGFTSVKTIGNYSFYAMTYLYNLDITSLISLTAIPAAFLSDCLFLSSVDVSQSPNIQSISNQFCGSATRIKTFNFSNLHRLTSIGTYFLYKVTQIESIQIGNVDWTNVVVNTANLMNNVPNNSTKILYADTQELASIFKAKMGGAISAWTVVLN